MNVDKPIKVLLVASYYPPEHTGAGLRSHRTFTRIKEKYPVETLVLTKNRQSSTDQFENYEGMQVLRIKTGNTLLQYIYNIGRTFYKYNLKSYDIVYCGGDVHMHIAAGIWAKMFSQPFFIEVVKNKVEDTKDFITQIKSVINFLRFRYLREKLQRSCNLSIALNTHIKEYYRRIGVPDEKIWVRPNPVDTRNFNLPTQEQRKRARIEYGINGDKYVHLLIGAIKARKNQLFAVKYLKALPKHHAMVIAGPVSDKIYFEELKKFIRDNRLYRQVLLLTGFRNDVKLLYHASDVLVVPSLAEGTPNVMLEALCCGLPVLINNSLGLDEYIQHSHNGYSAHLSVDEFVSGSLVCEKTLNEYSKRYKIAKDSGQKYGHEIIDKQLYKYLRTVNNDNGSYTVV